MNESDTDDPGATGLDPRTLRTYAATVLELGDDPALVVDLRKPLTADDAARVTTAVGPAFTVITAENPPGVRRRAAENVGAMAALRTTLETGGDRFVRADGRNPEGTHREAGFAVVGALEPVLGLARAFAQAAVFRFEDGRFLIVESATGVVHPLPAHQGGGGR